MANSRVSVTIYERNKSGADMLRLPVPPDGIPEQPDFTFTDLEVFGAGEVTLFGRKRQRRIPLTFIWPKHYNPTICTRKPDVVPIVAGARLKKWQAQRAPVRVVFSTTQLSGVYTIRDLSLEWERPGSVGDLWVSLTLVEYVAPKVTKTTLKSAAKPKPTPSKPRSTPPKRNQTGATSYTVRNGDSLSIIAQRVWGEGGKKYYDALYNANKTQLHAAQRKAGAKSIYTIYPGQKLKVPAKPGALESSSKPKEH